MAKFSYDILFGSDIKSDLRAKLQVRQNLAKSSEFGDPVAYSGSIANPKSITNSDPNLMGYGDVNASDFDSVVDLSSRMPWARMWVAIEKFNLDPDINDLQNLSDEDANDYIEKLREGTGEINKKVTSIDLHIVGNQSYHSYLPGGGANSSRVLDPADPTAGFIYENNPWMTRTRSDGSHFLEPQAGIIDIESADSGDYGLIRETTVKFNVPSYDDFVNIFQPFFLLPGARIFLDFGWSTSTIYDPLDVIQKDAIGEKDIFTNLWGEDGIVNNSHGDMEVLTGAVSKYDTNVEEDGTFTCSVTIVSYNYKLLDHSTSTDLGDDVTIADFIKVGVNERVKDYATSKLGIDLTNIPVDESRLLAEVLPTVLAPTQTFSYLGKQASADEAWKTTGGAKLKAIPEDYYHYGIYFDPLGTMGKTEMDVFNTKYANVTSGEIYITFQLLEELLNDYISTQWGKDESNDSSVTDDLNKKPQNVKYNFYAGEFDKLDLKKLDTELLEVENETVKQFQLSQGFTEDGSPKADGKWGPTTKSYYERQMAQCTFDEYLYTKQAYMDTNEQFPMFKYPTKWRISEDGKFEQLSYSKGKFDRNKSTKLGTPKSVPVYKLWLKLSSVLSALSKQSLKEGLNDLITTLNRESSGAFNFKFLPNTTRTEIRLYDTNYRPDDTIQVENKSTNIVETVSKVFTFNVFSPNTIVSSMDLKSEMGNDNYSNRMLIQGMSVGNLIFPVSDETLLDLAIKDMNAAPEDDQRGYGGSVGSLYFSHLPSLSENSSENTVKNKIKIYQANLDEDGNVGRGNLEGPLLTKKFSNLLDRLADKGFVISDAQQAAEEIKANIPTATHTFKSSTADCPQDSGPFPKNICVNSLTEFFDTTIRGYRAESSIHSVILPWTLSFSIYGISGLVPGNRFQIDYLPKRYRDVAYFIIERTRHTVSADGWQTHIDARMHFKNDFSLQHSVLYKPNILPSKVLLAKLGYSEDQFEDIYEKAQDNRSRANFWEIIPYNIAVKKTCMDPRAWNFLKTPPDSVNAKWDGNSDCSGKRPSSLDSKQKTYIDEDGDEVTAEQFASAQPEDDLALFTGETYLSWVTNTDGNRDDSCCVYCEQANSDQVSVCQIPSAWMDEKIVGNDHLINLDGFGDLSNELHNHGYATQEELFLKGLFWLSKDTCFCVNVDDLEAAEGDRSEVKKASITVNDIKDVIGNSNEATNAYNKWLEKNPGKDIVEFYNEIYLGSNLDNEFKNNVTEYLSGNPAENIMSMDLPGSGKYAVDDSAQEEEYFKNLEYWMKQLDDNDLGPEGTKYEHEFVSVIRAQNAYVMLSPYDWKAHKLSQLNCQELYPDFNSLKEQEEFITNAFNLGDLTGDEYTLAKSALEKQKEEITVKGYNPIEAKNQCEAYKKSLEKLYDSTIERIMNGEQIAAAKTTLDCWQTDGAGNFTHPFPEMCQETERLTRTFLALSQGWSKLATDNPDIYDQVKLHGTLPSSLKAVDTSNMSKSKRREFFKDSGLTYTDEGDIFYVDEDTTSDQETGLPDSAFGCTDSNALNYDPTKYEGKNSIYCLYHGCAACSRYSTYKNFRGMVLYNGQNSKYCETDQTGEHCVRWGKGQGGMGYNGSSDYAGKFYKNKKKKTIRKYSKISKYYNATQIMVCQGGNACYGHGFDETDTSYAGYEYMAMSLNRGYNKVGTSRRKKQQPFDIPPQGLEIFEGTFMEGVNWIMWCMWQNTSGGQNSCYTTCACDIASGGAYKSGSDRHRHHNCPNTDNYTTWSCQYF